MINMNDEIIQIQKVGIARGEEEELGLMQDCIVEMQGMWSLPAVEDEKQWSCEGAERI